MGTTETQIIATLAGITLTGASAFLGHYLPIWIGQFRKWSRNQTETQAAHDAAIARVAEITKERDELRASLTAASQGSTVTRDLITGLQEQIDDMRADFTRRLDDAVRYIVDLTLHIRDGKAGPLPDPPESISEDVRAEIARSDRNGVRS